MPSLKGLRPKKRAKIEEVRPLSLVEFVDSISNGKYIWYDHCLEKASVLQRVADGELKRVMFFEPPRHGKSELVSRYFPAYLLHRFPERYTAVSSYSADLAYTFSRAARDRYLEAGGQAKDDSFSVKQWETGKGGGLWATGIGGPATGKGFHFGIIDDPIKNAQDAASNVIRERQWEWFQSVWTTREEPGGAQIITLTRWNEDDIAGRIIKEQMVEDLDDSDKEVWYVVSFEAIKTDTPPKFPSHWIIHSDNRLTGEPLCPERYDLSRLEKMRRRLGGYFFGALFQQNPKLPSGNLWKRHWFRTFSPSQLPETLYQIGYDWDTAYTDDEKNAATAYVKMAKDSVGNIYLLDLGFRWVEFPDMVGWMKSISGAHYIERKASGKSAAQSLKQSGIYAVEVDVMGGLDKYARASLVTHVVESGKVLIAEHLLSTLLDDEKQGILGFPNGSHADLNDAFVQALNRLQSAVWGAV